MITGTPFLDLTTDDREAEPSCIVKDKEQDDDGAAVKGDPLDFSVFDYRHR